VRARIALAAALAAVAGLALTGTPGDAATTRTVSVGAGGDDRMSPARSTVAQGDTVVFSWQDGGHDLVLGGPEGTNVGEQDRGFKLTRRFDRPGSYTFMCTLHDDMSATLDVTPVAGAETPSAPPAVDVVVGPDGDGGFSPADVTVVEGQTVNWQWGDDSRNVTFADGAASGTKSIGGFYSRTFADAGTYAYRDTRQGSTGTVKVVEAGAGGAFGIRRAAAGATPAARITVGPGNSFAPSSVAIDEGGTVEWNWAGGPHNVRFDDGTDSGFRSSGTAAMTFWLPGVYTYVCAAHSGMSGSVRVNDTGAAGPNQQPPDDTGTPGGGETPPPDPDPGEPGDPPAASVSVGGAANAFAPADLTVRTGRSVVWSWAGGVHNVHFEDGRDSQIRSSGTWSRRFLNPGTYRYACDLHPGMAGRVVAEGEPVAGEEPPADPTPGAEGTPGGARPVSRPPTARTAAAPPADRAAGPAAPGTAGPDRAAPVLRALRPALSARSRRGHRLRLVAGEDAMLLVTVQRLRRSRDPVAKRSFKVYARKGASSLRLPVMNLASGRYRIRVVAVDRAGNRSAPRTLTVRVS
jgi:plastocyanin